MINIHEIHRICVPQKKPTVRYGIVCTDCSIREYRSDFSPLFYHNLPAYYALKYAGIFDGGLGESHIHSVHKACLFVYSTIIEL